MKSDMSKNIINEDGTEETIIISSEDDLKLDLKNNTYRLANHTTKKQSKLTQKFKGSILGADIGVKSGGFTSIAILASVIAIGTLAIMYFSWRF